MKYLNGTIVIIFSIVLIVLLSFQSAESQSPGGTNKTQLERSNAEFAGPPAEYGYHIVNTYPHDTRAFTQGLFFAEGHLYEGTGIYGRSALRKVAPETGRVLKEVQLSAKLFGEGIVLYQDKIIQLTWKSRTGLVYDKESFRQLHTFKLFSEGWGVTFDDRRLVVSDGSSTLYFLDADTYEKTGQVQVFNNRGPVNKLNELEYVQGKIYANIWQSDSIVMIDHTTGRITGHVDLSGLTRLAGGDRSYRTLNGIAYDPGNDRLFVTGKLWPSVYEIKIVPVK